MESNDLTPAPQHKFSFGLWTVGNRGRDPFGEAVRPTLPPNDIVAMLGEVGACGVNFHDNDLVPIDATPAERDRIVGEFRHACETAGVVVPMATVNLFYDPAFRDGAFTANDADVRAYAVQKTMRAMDLGAELGAKIFVLWGGREGVETDACRRPDEAVKRLREALNYLVEYSESSGYGYRFALEAKPNEPRADIYMPTTGAYLGFIATLDKPHLVGVNPEVAHEHMAGLNMTHAVAQAWEAGKLFHIDLNDQIAWPVRSGPSLRIGESARSVLAREVPRRRRIRRRPPFRRACLSNRRLRRREGLRARLHANVPASQSAGRSLERGSGDSSDLSELAELGAGGFSLAKFSKASNGTLLAKEFDRASLAAKKLPYERLDQLTIDMLLGVR